jgi:hypothetical protein
MRFFTAELAEVAERQVRRTERERKEAIEKSLINKMMTVFDSPLIFNLLFSAPYSPLCL